MTTPELARHARLSGQARIEVAEQVAARYRDGDSIRTICADTGYSIGRVRGLLLDAGVSFRRRGGSHPRPAPTER